MSQNVSQWLEEIKTLQQQLAEAQREREQAYTSMANWQRLYETEAQQRRSEVSEAKQTIAVLQQEIQQLRSYGLSNSSGESGAIDSGAINNGAIQAAVENLNDVELRSHLIQALAECDRLRQALETEQANHLQTRQSLTTALGDAIDALKGKRVKSGE